MSPLLHAHRGAAAELPENTLPSFLRALELGAQALETDAHLTRDGQVVLAHDPDGRRMCGVRRKVAECTLAEVQAWDAGFGFLDAGGARPFAGQGFRVPTLEELLAATPGVRLNVDVKEPALAEVIVALLRRLKAQDRVLLASFQSSTLQAIRAMGWEGATGLGQGEVARLALLPERVLARWPVRGSRAQVPVRAGPVRLGTRAFVERCHRLGLAVDFWTVNDAAEADRLAALGADGIMTDDPARVVRATVFSARPAASR